VKRGEMMYTDFIWANLPVMYAIDALIITTALLALYFGLQVRKMILGKLQNSFVFILIGVQFIAVNYLLDAYSMVMGNMPLMMYFHHNIFWVLNAIGFVLVTVGFYQMREAFKAVTPGKEQ